MTFDTCRRGLDIIGKFNCVVGAIELIIGLIGLMAGLHLAITGTTFALVGGIPVLFIGFLLLIQGAIKFIEGYFSLKAVKDLTKIMPAYILSIVAFVGSCMSMISCIVTNQSGAAVAGALFACAINAAFLFFTSTLKKEKELIKARRD